eukprot:387620-Rhodomonas_salina.1
MSRPQVAQLPLWFPRESFLSVPGTATQQSGSMHWPSARNQSRKVAAWVVGTQPSLLCPRKPAGRYVCERCSAVNCRYLRASCKGGWKWIKQHRDTVSRPLHNVLLVVQNVHLNGGNVRPILEPPRARYSRVNSVENAWLPQKLQRGLAHHFKRSAQRGQSSSSWISSIQTGAFRIGRCPTRGASRALDHRKDAHFKLKPEDRCRFCDVSFDLREDCSRVQRVVRHIRQSSETVPLRNSEAVRGLAGAAAEQRCRDVDCTGISVSKRVRNADDRRRV